MGRQVRESQHLLDNAEQNIGNSEIVHPQVGPGGPTVPSGTTIPQTNPPRIIQLTGPSQKGQTTSVVMTVSRITPGPLNPNPGFAGPITGILEFGNGGRSTRVEFDIPVGPFIGSLTSAVPASEPQDGGVIVTVPTGVLRAYARYDNLLLAPTLPLNVSLAQLKGQPVIGPGGPVVFAFAPPLNIGYSEPVQAKAMAAYFSRHTSRVYKTLYLYRGNAINVSIGGLLGLAWCLPAFARSVKVLRQPISAALTCSLSNGINNIDDFEVVANASAPVIPVIGGENIIQIKSKTALPADDVTYLALVCEIGI